MRHNELRAPQATIKVRDLDGALHEIFICTTAELQAHQLFFDQVASLARITPSDVHLLKVVIHPEDNPSGYGRTGIGLLPQI